MKMMYNLRLIGNLIDVLIVVPLDINYPPDIYVESFYNI